MNKNWTIDNSMELASGILDLNCQWPSGPGLMGSLKMSESLSLARASIFEK